MAGKVRRRFEFEDRYYSYRDWRLQRRHSLLPGFFPRLRWNWRRRTLNHPSETPFAHLMIGLFMLVVMVVAVGSCGLFFMLLFRYW
jgi:hypothetical protein